MTARAIAHNAFHDALETAGPPPQPDLAAIVEPLLPETGPVPLPVPHRSVSYRELLDGAGRLAGALDALGVGPGDGVLLMMPMSIALYRAMCGVMKRGAVCLFIDPADGVAQLDRTAASLAPRAFIGTPTAQKLRLVCPSLRAIPVHVSTGPSSPAAELLDTLIAEGQPRDTEAVALDDPAIISFTSGSSGAPKGVRRTHHDLRAQFHVMCAHEGKRAKGVNLCAFPVLPIDDVSAGRTSLLAAVRPGKAAEADPAALLDQLRQYPATLVSVPPILLEKMLGAAREPGVLASIRHVYTGGGPVPVRALERARTLMPQAEVNLVYGSTEAEPVSMITGREVLQETAARERKGEGACVGRLAPGVEVRFEDEELLVTGPHVNREYYRDPEQTALHKVFDAATGKHWHRMGDLGRQDEAGRLWIVGRRANRVVTRDGPLDTGRVEPPFEALPGVARAALIAVPVVQRGQPHTAAAVLLELAPGADRIGVVDAAKALVSERQLPVAWVQEVLRIPLDARIGAKKQYAALRERYGPLIRQRLSDPFGERLQPYFRERFPLAASAFGALLFTLGIGAASSWRLLTAAGAVFLFFFHLRVYDEQKDGHLDRVTHPHRALSRGIVTVEELTSLSRTGVFAQGLIALALGWTAAGWWLVALVWSWLMRREFFLGDALRARTALYGISHTAVVFWLAQFVVASAGAPTPDGTRGVLAMALAWLAEVARKLDPVAGGERAADESAESYVRELGMARTMLLLVALTATAGGAAWAVGGSRLAVGAGVGLVALALAGYVRAPSKKTGKSVHGASLLLALIVYGALALRGP